MEFEYTDPQTELERLIGGHFCINAFGRVDPGDDEKFKGFIVQAMIPPRIFVYIDSGGGDVEAAIRIGRTIRESWMSTSIGRYLLDHSGPMEHIVSRRLLPGKCISAATLIFLGGKLRQFPSGSRFGVHQFSFADPSPENIGRSQILSAKISAFVQEMGVSSDFLQVSSFFRNEIVEFLSEDNLKSMRVVTGGETAVSWTVQAIGNMIYVRGERDSIYGHHKIMLCYAEQVGFMIFAVIESQGREGELLNFPLVEVIVNGEDTRFDISNRCERSVSGNYTNIISKITNDEARLIAYSSSFGMQIRLASDAPIFLGISAMETEGGVGQLNAFYGALAGGR